MQAPSMKVVFLALAAISWTTSGVQVAAQSAQGVRGQEEFGDQPMQSRALKGSVQGISKSHSKDVGGSSKMIMGSTAKMKGMKKRNGNSGSGKTMKLMKDSISKMPPTPSPVAPSPPPVIPVDTSSPVTPPPTSSPAMIPVDIAASRALWNEIDTERAYPWPVSATSNCLVHPLFLFFSSNSDRPYEVLAQALTVLFQDPRVTIPLLEGMVVSDLSRSSSSSCGRVFDYAKTLEMTSDLLISEEIRTALQEARVEMESRFGNPIPASSRQPQEDPARALWEDIDGGIFPWSDELACIQHPTFRGGSVASYTAAAVSLTKAFLDARLTAELEDQIVFNILATIPPSNCAPMTLFSRDLEQFDGLIGGEGVNSLTAARMAFEERIAA
jgi:hypothetical protein